MTVQIVSARQTSSKDVVREEGPLRVTPYHGRPKETSPGPQSFMLEALEPGASVAPHFHAVDQFQVFWRGGMAGRDAAPGCLVVHYADAFSSYGPITSPPEAGYHYLTVRASSDPGPQWMPESRDRHRGGRRFEVEVALDRPAGEVATVLGPYEDGLAVHVVRLDSGEAIPRFGPSGGVHYLVLDGAVVVDGQGHEAFADLFVERESEPVSEDEATAPLTAGASGSLLLVLQFRVPEPSGQPA